MKQFTSIEKLDTVILYLLELASSLSVLLLAAGLIASMSNVLTQGMLLSDSKAMQIAYAISQSVAIDAGLGTTIIRTFRYHQEGEKVKTWLYGLLSALLLFTAAIVSNIEAVQQALNITLQEAYIHVFIPIEALIWVRSITVVLLIVAHALRHVQVGKPKVGEVAQPQAEQPLKLDITPELIVALRELLTQPQTDVYEEQPETKQIEAPKEETTSLERIVQQLDTLLPDVSREDISAVVTAYCSGVQRREMTGYLRWGGSKYTTIVKPVLDAYEQLQQTA
jgi:hypothetical protein